MLIHHIQVDFYTKSELDQRIECLLRELEGSGVYQEEPEISYDAETGYTRYMIECQIIDTTMRRMTNGK